MSRIRSLLDVPEPATSPAARFTPGGRLAAAGTLVLGAGLQLASFAIEPANDETIDRLRWIADNPDRANLAKLCDVLAMPFLIATVLVYVLLSRERSPRLSYAGGALLGFGLVGLTLVQGFETLQFGLAQDGRFDLTELADAIDDATIPPAIAMIVLLLVGGFFGLLTIAAALWRSGAVARGAVLLIPAFVLVDFILQQGLAGHVIQFVAACWIAWAVLRAGRTAPRREARARFVIPALLVIVAALGGACGGKDNEARPSGPGEPANSFPGTADYSISTARLDRELACKGGKEELSGEGADDPVLLVHGTTVTREQNWGWNYWDALPGLGYEVCWVQLPDLAFGDIQTASEYVARAVEVMHERTGESIDVLGHSQGGLEPRWVIKWFPAGAFVDDYIALATPNHGSSTFDKTPARREVEAGWQMRTNSNFLAALNRGDETPGPIDYTSIYSRTDELIQPVGTQNVEGGTNILLQDLCPGRRVDHGALASDDVTYRLVIDALANTGTANSDRTKVNCARNAFPGVGKPPPFGPPPKGTDPHFADHEPPLELYARG